MALTHFITTLGIHLFRLSVDGTYLEVSSTHVHHTDVPSEAAGGSLLGGPDAGTKVLFILGTIKLKMNKYIVVVDRHEAAGRVLGREIARVASFKIYPLSNDTLSKKDPEEGHYLALLNQHLLNATLYFAVAGGFDLTNSLQRQLAGGASDQPALDARFWWNQYLCTELLDAGAAGFVFPVIYGYFKSHTATFQGVQMEFALITRRATARAGTRYFRRGIDADGAVANFNETEQVLTVGPRVFLFLQTRGSVPVYWSEINNLKYKPNLVILSRVSKDATAKHFREQVDYYGDNYCVNLVNQLGYEQPVKLAYETAVSSLPPALAAHVTYIYFDFHHECRKMRWDRVKLLIDHLVDLGFANTNYFAYDCASSTVLSTQNKVVRTNCMDCLDRTNVVQSMLGRWVLQAQLEAANCLPRGSEPWELRDPAFNLFFQLFWADNADAVSCAYSGTGALKTDYTRTGKRTKLGALNDFVNSVTRYYLNNYKDGQRQDSYDLFLGRFKPFQDAVANPFLDRRFPYTQLVPYLIGASMLILVALLMYPSGQVLGWRNVLFIGGCLYFGIRNLLYVLKNGYQFINWPKLIPLDYLKKTDVFGPDGKFVGIRYEENDDFKTSKKRN